MFAKALLSHPSFDALDEGVLNLHWLRSMRHAREAISSWRKQNHTKCSHSALGYLAAKEFLKKTTETGREILAVSKLALNTQTRPEESRSNRP